MAGTHHLHEDIVFDIFVRMPTKPLLQFRRLSKHWNRLISDHFTKSRARRMILLPLEPLYAIDYTVPGARDVHSVLIKNHEHEDAIIVGAFKGIVLLVLKDMILYNPLTGSEFKIVPDPPLASCGASDCSYGFGYGTTLDDLHIVRVRHWSETCDVFSLKRGSWSTISKTVPSCSVYDYAGTFVNGFLYWMAFGQGYDCFIIAFDVKEMVFSEIRVPYRVPYLACLGTFSGCLYLSKVDNYSAKYELWVMNNDKKSWSKVLTSNALAGYNIPLFIIDVGMIVLWNLKMNPKQVISIYDMLKDSYEVYVVNGSLRRLRRLKAVEYVESLISPSDLCSNS